MQKVRQDLSALFGSMGHPAISTLVSYACGALAYHAYPLAAEGGNAGAVGAALAIWLPVFFLASWLGAGTLAFVVDAKRSYLPGSQRLARRAKFLASALLLPALIPPIAALAENPPGRDWVPTVLGLASSAALALLAVANWRRMIRQGSRPRSLPRWRAASRYRSRDHQRPVQIIRTCLGGIFVELSARQLIIGVLLLTLFIVTAIGLPRLGASEARGIIIALTLAAAGLVSSGFLTQISKLTRGQIAELALMPGLGAAAAQYRALCGAVLAPPLLWLGIMLLLGSAALLFKGEPLSSIGVLAACIFVIWLTYTVFALQMLATFPARRQSFISQFLLLYVAVYPALALQSFVHILQLFWWVWTIPVLLGVGIAGAISVSVRRLAAAPHPFLTWDSAMTIRGSSGRLGQASR